MSDPFGLGQYRSEKESEDFLSFLNNKNRNSGPLNDPNSSENRMIGFGLQALVIAACVLAISIPLAVFSVGGYLVYWAYEKKEDRGLRLMVTFLLLVLFLHILQAPVLQAVRSGLGEYPGLLNKFEGVVTAMYQRPYDFFIHGWLRNYVSPEDLLPVLLAFFSIPGAMLVDYLHREHSNVFWTRLFLSRRYYRFLRSLGIALAFPFVSAVRWATTLHWAATVIAIVLIGVGIAFGYDKLFPNIAPTFFSLFMLPFFHWPLFTWIWYRIYQDLHPPSSERVPCVRIGRDSLGAEVGFSLSELQHHMHVVGQSGSGKSVFLRNLYAHHIRYGLGFAFIDLKADWETVEELVSLAKKHDRLSDLQILHLSEPALSLPYNVLARGNATELKDKLIGALDWSEIHYKKVAERVLLDLCRGLVIVRDETKQVVTLADLHRCLVSPSAIRILANEVPAKYTDVRKDLLELAQDFSVQAKREQIEGLRTDLEVMVKSEFGRLLTSGKPGIDLADIIEQGKILYVLLDSQRFGESSRRLGKLLLSDLKVVSGRLISGDLKTDHFAVIVDEFSELATEEFIGFLNKARGSKIAVTIAHQELSDLQRFSDTLRDQIFGCTQTTVAFLQKNPMSAEVLASMIGTKSGKELTKQTSEGVLFRGYTGTGSEKTVEQFRIHPNEFKNLNVGEAIVIRKNPPRSAKIRVNFLPLSKEPMTEEVALAINQVPNNSDTQALHLKRKERIDATPKSKPAKKSEKKNSKPTLSDWKIE